MLLKNTYIIISLSLSFIFPGLYFLFFLNKFYFSSYFFYQFYIFFICYVLNFFTFYAEYYFALNSVLCNFYVNTNE